MIGKHFGSDGFKIYWNQENYLRCRPTAVFLDKMCKRLKCHVIEFFLKVFFDLLGF